jgi:hypothetical protein
MRATSWAELADMEAQIATCTSHSLEDVRDRAIILVLAQTPCFAVGASIALRRIRELCSRARSRLWRTAKPVVDGGGDRSPWPSGHGGWPGTSGGGSSPCTRWGFSKEATFDRILTWRPTVASPGRGFRC